MTENNLVGHRYERPWGSYTTLYLSDYCQVKSIIVHPESAFSLQKHSSRTEHWTIVRGQLWATVDQEEKELHVGDDILIPVGVLHRMRNRSAEIAEFIEVQTGGPFLESDIIRIADDYGRS